MDKNQNDYQSLLLNKLMTLVQFKTDEKIGNLCKDISELLKINQDLIGLFLFDIKTYEKIQMQYQQHGSAEFMEKVLSITP